MIEKLFENRIFKRIFAFQATPFYIVLLAVVAFLSHVFGLDILGFYVLGLSFAFTLLFNPDTKPSLPSIAYLLLCISRKNAPNNVETALQNYYLLPANLSQIIAIVSVVVVLIVVRFIMTGNIKKSFKSSTLIYGLIAVAGGLLLNGVFSSNYTILNLAMGLVFAFILVFVFLFYYGTIRYDGIKYLSWVMLVLGLAVSAELGVLYASNELLRQTFDKDLVSLGWSISNSIAYVLIITLPFGFYFIKNARFSLPYFLLTLIILIAVVFTFSRGSLVVAVPLCIIGGVYVCFTAREKISVIVCAALLLVCAVVFFVLFREKILEMLKFYIDTGLSDRGRFKLWFMGLDAFRRFPIFGVGQMFKFGEVGATFTWFHNTLIHFLATGGIVGLASYIYHRIETIMLLFKKPTLERWFIGASVAALLINGMFDVAMSMPHMLMMYAILLAFADKDHFKAASESRIQKD